MSATTRVLSVSVPVPDPDAALAFYRDVLGCDVAFDGEPVPGTRMVEVVPPGSAVAIVLLPPDGEVPVAVRLGTTSADEAYARIDGSDATVHNAEVLRWEGVPPMFAFADPWGNQLVYLEDDGG